MNIKAKLTQLNTEFASLRTKIKSKLEVQTKTITETTSKLNESNRKLELALKENSEHEKVLAQLLKEMKELGEEMK